EVADPEAPLSQALTKTEPRQNNTGFFAVSITLLALANRRWQSEPQQRQGQPQTQVEQGQNHERSAPVPGAYTPPEQAWNQGRGEASTRQANRQSQATIAVKPQVKQLGPR